MGKKKIIIKNSQKQIIREYLDKEYGIPLYRYLQKGNNIQHKENGKLQDSKELIPFFFYYIRKKSSRDEWMSFCNFVVNHNKLSKFFEVYSLKRHIEMKDGRNLDDFIKTNRGALYRIIAFTPPMSKIWENFIKWYNNDITTTYTISTNGNLDANTTLYNPRVNSVKWLIHFTPKESNAIDILKNGFKSGVKPNQISKIAYTRNIDDGDKTGGVYSFAYDVYDVLNDNFVDKYTEFGQDYGFKKNFDKKVWSNAVHYAVMFQAPGIKVNHMTDQDEQVIFNNKTARNFVLLRFCWPKNQTINNRDKKIAKINIGGGDTLLMWWEVADKNLKPLYKNSSISEVIKWVVTNYNQYNKVLRESSLLNESRDLNGIGGIRCYSDFDEDEYIEWLQDNNKQDTPESKNEYLKDYVVFTVEYLDADTMHGMGEYDGMSYDEIFDNFGDKMGSDIVNTCIDGRDHEFDLYDYEDTDEFDLSNTQELNKRAKSVMTVVDSPCGKFRGWVLTDGTVLDAGWDHNACFKISPNQIRYREDFTLLGNVRFSDVSLEFGKFPTQPQLVAVREFCEYHQHDSIFVDFLGGKNGRKSKQYSNGLDYDELYDDLYWYYAYGNIRDNLYESIDELDLYHGTHADFDQFKEEFYLSGVGEMAYGWGVYLTNSINTAKEYSPGGQIMTVEVPDGKYLNSERIGKAEASKLARAFYRFYLNGKGAEIYRGSEQEFWDYECKYLETVPDGSYMYGTVSTFLGSDKEASEWFHSMGYAGLKFPGHNANTGEKFMNYVIFDAKDVKIINKQKTDSLNENVNVVRGITKHDICNRTMSVIERRNGVELSDEGKKWFIGLMNGAKFGITMDMILEKASFSILNIPSFPVGQSVGNEWDELDGILRIVIQKTGLGNDILQRLRSLKFGEDRKIISDDEWASLESALQYYPDILKELKRCYNNFSVVAPVIYKAVDYLKRYKDGTPALEFCYLVGYQREHARASLDVAVDQVLHGIGSHLLPKVISKK